MIFSVILYAIILFAINFIRIFDGQFWADEIYSIQMIDNGFGEILTTTAGDMHPPLYYWILKLFVMIFGNNAWVYHFCSVVPLAIMLVVIIAFMRKEFGTVFAIIMMTFCGISSSAIEQNVQVRMYSWGQMFLVLGFFELYLALKYGKKIHYFLLSALFICASYTHYYCLMAVGIAMVLLVISSFLLKRGLKESVISSAAIALVYLPWGMVLLNTVRNLNGDYWIDSIPSVKKVIVALFDNVFPVWAIAIIALAIIVTTYIENKSVGFADLLWLIIGGTTILGSIFIAITVSHIITPVFVLRYIYPCAGIAWMMLAYGFSKSRKMAYVGYVVVIYLLVRFIPSYWETYAYEKNTSEQCEQTVSDINAGVKTGDSIYTNVEHLSWNTVNYYFPELNVIKIDDGMIDNNSIIAGDKSWLMTNGEADVELFKSKGYDLIPYIEDGYLGDYLIYLYKIE